MSAKYTDTILFAYDADHNRHVVATEYFYAGACYYSKRIEVKDLFYEIEDFVGEDTKTSGTYLPQINLNHCESYFSDMPDEAMRILLRESELDGINIDHFLLISVDSVNSGPYFATCSRISCDGIISREYDLCENPLVCTADANDEVDAVIQALIGKAEKEDSYWNSEQPQTRKYAETITCGMSDDNNLYLVFRESSHIDESGNRSYRAMLSNICFLLHDYTELPEDDELPFPYAYVADYESYFSTAPSNTIEALLLQAKLADKRFTCFVMVDMNTNSDGNIDAVCHVISPEKTDVHEYSVKDFDEGLLRAIESM